MHSDKTLLVTLLASAGIAITSPVMAWADPGAGTPGTSAWHGRFVGRTVITVRWGGRFDPRAAARRDAGAR